MPFYDKIQVEFNHGHTAVGTPAGDLAATIEDRVCGEDTGPFARRIVLVSKMERLLRTLCRAANAGDFPEDVAAKREAREMFRELDDTDDADERGGMSGLVSSGMPSINRSRLSAIPAQSSHRISPSQSEWWSRRWSWSGFRFSHFSGRTLLTARRM